MNFPPCCKRDNDGDGNCDWHKQVRVRCKVKGHPETYEIVVPRTLYYSGREDLYIQQKILELMNFEVKILEVSS